MATNEYYPKTAAALQSRDLTVALQAAPLKLPVKKPGLVKRAFQAVEDRVEKRGLESNLEFYLNAARAHEANGVPQGDGVYRILFRNAMKDAQKYGVPRSLSTTDLYAAYPALKVLAAFATVIPEPSEEEVMAARQEQAKRWMKIGTAALIGLPIGWGLMSGIAALVDHLIRRLGGM